MLNKNYEQLKIMLDGNWKYIEKLSMNNNETHLILMNAGDIIAIYPAEEGEGLELYYKSDLSFNIIEFYPETGELFIKTVGKEPKIL